MTVHFNHWTGNRLAAEALIVAFVLGVFGRYLWWPGSWGLNVMLFTAALLAGMAMLVKRYDLRIFQSQRASILLLLTFVTSAASLWRDSSALKWLDIFLLFALLSQIGSLSRTGTGKQTGYFTSMWVALWYACFGVLDLIISVKWSRRTIALTRGLIFGIPLVIVFGILFSLADKSFAKLAERFLLPLVNKDYLFSIFVMTWLIAGYLRCTFLSSSDESDDGEVTQRSAFGNTELGIILGGTNLIIAIFIGIQAQYFFGGEAAMKLAEINYSDYARRGFVELLLVLAINLPLLWHLHRLIGFEPGETSLLFNGLAATNIALLFGVMLSALERIELYVRQYGYTELRLFSLVFLGWLALQLIWFMLTVLRGWRDRFSSGVVSSALILVVGLHFFNPVDFIVRSHFARLDAKSLNHPLDIDSLAQMGADAVPILLQSRHKLSIEEQTSLLERLDARWGQSHMNEVNWRTWNSSRSSAYQLVGVVQPRVIAAE